jgi:murein L,D-transpeptidase YafK
MKWMQVFIASMLLVYSAEGWGQSNASAYTFINYQRSFPRISNAADRVEDSLMKQFRKRNLVWPAKYIYIRSFKYDSQLEVWIKQEKEEAYQLFKTYKVCALSGSLGPKRMQGDYQVPEGFYYINQFNPNSNYHLSLGLNYPNLSDRVLSDSLQPGGDIFIHGSCVTTGCIPIMDSQIEELYILASHARNEGQDFIPVHIFPVRYDKPKSADQLIKFLKQYPEYTSLNKELRKAYLFFEQTRQIPLILVNRRGGYIVESALSKENLSEATGSPAPATTTASESGFNK